MTTQQRFRAVGDLMEAVGEVHPSSAGEADALMLPRMARPAGTVHAIALFYREGMGPGEETVYAPHHVVTVDAATGDVVESRPCVPSDFGVAQAPGAATQGFGLDPEMSVDEFWDLLDRFADLSPAVWELYANGAARLDRESAAVVREHDACFRRIAKAPLMPYYEAIAGDFFGWTSEVIKEGSRR